MKRRRIVTLTMNPASFPYILFSCALPSRPIRTPSERSRARSLDDLSKSGSPSLRHHHLGSSPPSSEEHHHYSPHYNYRVMGSDNGLDRIDWDDHHEYSRPSFHTTGSWHHSLASTSSKTMRDDEDDDDHSRDEVIFFYNWTFISNKNAIRLGTLTQF